MSLCESKTRPSARSSRSLVDFAVEQYCIASLPRSNKIYFCDLSRKRIINETPSPCVSSDVIKSALNINVCDGTITTDVESQIGILFLSKESVSSTSKCTFLGA